VTRQTRCDLALVMCEGTTYALPRDSGSTTRIPCTRSDASQVLDLDVVVAAGTIVSGAELEDGDLIECDMYGSRVLVPRNVLEEMN
jgi:hypothetical protein